MNKHEALMARSAIDSAAAQALMACSNTDTLLAAHKLFMTASEEAIARLLASTHSDDAALAAQDRKDHWVREFARAVAGPSNASP